MFFDGFPFGSGFEQFTKPQPKKNVNTTRYYEILGVDKKASQEEIRKSYRKLVKIKHPDKGGNQKEFQELQTAYDVLSDENKRKVYDEYGEEGIKEGMDNQPEGVDIFDILSGRGRKQGKKKTRSVLQQMKVSLEDIYLGKEKYLEIKHDRICKRCKGTGSKDPNAHTKCSTCDGRGYKMIVQRIAMGMIQTQQTCPDCRGEGEIIKEKCPECKGRKVKRESKLLKILLDKGAPDGKRYVLSGESDEIPGYEPGDIVIEIEIENHKKFIRKGADLIYKCNITLLEALTGFNIVITHLDGRKILIKTKPGEIIKPGILKTVSDCGMPFYESPVRFGNLYLDFNILFPKSLSEQQRNDLKALFPMAYNIIENENEITEKYPMTNYKESEANQYATGKEDERDDDREESGGPKQVNCGNQ